jgi:hypothetical protein
VWRLPNEMTETMKQRSFDQKLKTHNNNIRTSPAQVQSTVTLREESFVTHSISEPADRAYRFSVGQLPSWAQKQVNGSPVHVLILYLVCPLSCKKQLPWDLLNLKFQVMVD